MPSYRFLKTDRLKSRKLIGQAFSEGRSIAVFPVRLVYVKTVLPEGSGPVQVGFTVSKKSFRSAVQRNRIKRQMRESYRLKKNILLEGLAHTTDQFAWMLLYTAKEPLPYARIEAAMETLIRRFLNKR